MDKSTEAEVAVAAAKTVPPLTVAGLTLFGVQLSDWVLIFTLIWLTLQIGGFIFDKYRQSWYRDPKKDRRRHKNE